MALFGRRKPGFAKEVELKPSDMPGEFSDALDPAMHKAQETAEAAAQSPDPAPAPEEEKEPEKTKAQLLADFIRERSASGLITPVALISKDEEEIDKLLEEMAADPTCADIFKVKGQKDTYYYCEETMAHNYAKIGHHCPDEGFRGIQGYPRMHRCDQW